MPVKKCEICGSEFKARLSKIRCCCTTCRNTLISREKSLRYKKTNNCVVCGKEFEVGAVDAKKKTCSTECGYKLRGSLTSKSQLRTCLTCGKEFQIQLSKLKQDGAGRYCSDECLYHRNDNETERKCICCGNVFRSPPSLMHVKTCSTKCGYEWFSGSRHGRYIGATKKVVHDDGHVTTVANRWYAAKHNKIRFELLKRATPSWASENKIIEFYELADSLEKTTGMKYHVDHIVPLNGKTVSGLHNEFNLQVLPWLENLSKGNRYWPDKPT